MSKKKEKFKAICYNIPKGYARHSLLLDERTGEHVYVFGISDKAVLPGTTVPDGFEENVQDVFGFVIHDADHAMILSENFRRIAKRIAELDGAKDEA